MRPWLPLLTAALGCARAPSADHSAQLSSFDYAWTRIRDTYPDPAMHGLDWAAVGAELRPRAEAAHTATELRPVLEDLFARLGDSHFGVIPGSLDLVATGRLSEAPLPLDRHGEAGLDVRVLDGHAVLSRVDPGGPADQAGLRPGMIVERVGDLDLGPLIARVAAEETEARALGLSLQRSVLARLCGPPGSTLTLRVRDGADQAQDRTVTLATQGATWTTLGSLPDVPVHFTTSRLGDVALVRFDAFLDPVPSRWSEAMSGLQGVRGLVIDLRGNPGGVAPMAMGMAGYLIPTRGQSLGTMRFREATLNLVVSPRTPQFTGPVAVLVDGLSASSAEIFAAGLQKLGRATVFGEPSSGMALPSTWERLPNGDLIQFVTADFTDPSGARIEATGVVPDVVRPLTRAALLAGQDPALDAALAWIAERAAGGPP